MKRSRCSAGPWAIRRLAFSSSAPHSRPRIRKRRFPLPREARGRDVTLLYHIGDSVAADSTEAAALAPARSMKPDAGRIARAARGVCWALWICALIVGLLVFGDFIVRFAREAPFAWPSINGGF